MTPEQRQVAFLIELAFCGVALAFLSGGLAIFYMDFERLGHGRSLTDGNIQFQALSLGIYGLAALLLVPCRAEMARLLRESPLLVSLIALAIVSAAWSVLPAVTARRGVALALTFVFALYLACRIPPSALLRVLGVVMFLLAAGSLVIGLVDPAVGRHSDGLRAGAWRGLVHHKNALGGLMALAVLVFWFLRRDGAAWRWLAPLGMGLALLMLALSESRTAWFTLAASVAVLPLARLLTSRGLSRRLRAASFGLAAVGGAMLVLAMVEPLLQLAGRDLTLTGRTSLWHLAIQAGSENPWLGAGYRAFWTEASAGSVYRGLEHWGGAMGNGHSSFLDLWLELGFLGLALFVAAAVLSIKRALALLLESGRPEHAWYLCLTVYVLTYSVSEKVLMQQGDLAWLLFTTNLLLLRRRAPARAPRPVARVPARVRVRPVLPMRIPPAACNLEV